MAAWRRRRNFGDTAIIVFETHHILNFRSTDLYKSYVCLFRAKAVNRAGCYMKDLSGGHYVTNDFCALGSRTLLTHQESIQYHDSFFFDVVVLARQPVTFFDKQNLFL